MPGMQAPGGRESRDVLALRHPIRNEGRRMTNRLVEVQGQGQSIWYDNIRRGLIESGELKEMIERDGILGVTSNPSIFEKALAGSTDYDQALDRLVAGGVGDAKEIFEQLAIEDIRLAADLLLPVYERTGARDGFISMEVSPYLAHDTEGTVEEARRLHAAIGRANLMIKVPATPQGIPAIARLIGHGININVTLLFAVEVYEQVAHAYMEGLERRLREGGAVDRIASVASFFVSRIDSVIDQRLHDGLDETRDPERRGRLKRLLGRAAIANAKLAYARYTALCAGDRWEKLEKQGARTQRLLWASTGTKNPRYRKTLYVDELIGPDTVNTVPAETLDAFRTAGTVGPALLAGGDAGVQMAADALRQLERLGIPMREVTDRLLADGVRQFSEAFDRLLAVVEKKRQGRLEGTLATQAVRLGPAEQAVNREMDAWRAGGRVRRLWQRDASLWSGGDEADWLDWLHVVDGQRDHPEQLQAIAADVKRGGFEHVVVLGMGGSSLCPDVLSRTFGTIDGHPSLHVLDSTVPAQVKSLEKRIDPKTTLFIVSSKSGSTTEPNAFKQYFLARCGRAGAGRKVAGKDGNGAGDRFIAITDPGSSLYHQAKAERFRHICLGIPAIGGRYSALSNFGLVPAAVMGLDVPRLLERTEIMVQSCASSVPPEVNPGVRLGIIMGTLARQGRDKLTIVTSPGIRSLGGWIEQLIAESTGKQGHGIIPVDGERLGDPSIYGDDRWFVHLRLAADSDERQERALQSIEMAGHPVVRIALEEAIDLGQEFFRWEVATAVAGSILGINPFDQPDVEASKIATRRLTAEYEQSGKLPEEAFLIREDGLGLMADPHTSRALESATGPQTLDATMAAHLARVHPGDYFALNAYVEMNEENETLLQEIRHTLRDRRRVATTLGFGPRFLHSTGQLHKGGPNSGVFLQITSDDAEDLKVPGQKYTFGILKRFQAQGDYEVLAERRRRLLRVHLGADVPAGLARLRDLVRHALG
jgi:transaldolase/glucose-6-phosphate isomerase